MLLQVHDELIFEVPDPNSETDGLDEIFLPADTGVWGEATHIPNALLDNEIGAALDAIRASGAFVWFVIDACHSGTATRAAAIDEEFAVERQVKPEDLGIPGEKLTAAEAAGGTRAVGDGSAKPAFGASAPTSAEAAGKGGLVGFYAAQTVETTPEMPLPKGVEGATRYGLFTYTIFAKIAESRNPAMTYRQLGQAILQQYAADARTKPTPLFDGDLDAPVFGTKEGNAALQWPLTMANSAGDNQCGPAASPDARREARDHGQAAGRQRRRHWHGRGDVGQEFDQSPEAGRQWGQGCAHGRYDPAECLCARDGPRAEFCAIGGKTVGNRRSRRRSQAGQCHAGRGFDARRQALPHRPRRSR
jgi:hypothetical protein